MTRAETIKILSVMRAAYPKFYTGMRKSDLEDIVSLWSSMFDEPYELVSAAVKALIVSDNKGFPPAIGQVKEKMAMLKEPIGTSETEAWAMVSKACHNGFYGYKKEFNKLPPDVQRAVGRPEQLREWALIDEDTLETVVASNFMRTYRSVKSRNEEIKKLPIELQKAIGGMENKFQIGDSL